jgi:precorrin-6B methylase 1
MYILTIHGKEKEGAYSVIDDDGENILYLFEEEDDAIRFAMMLEESGSPEMNVIEVEDEIMIKTCEHHDYKYVVITPNDIVIPPNIKDDLI